MKSEMKNFIGYRKIRESSVPRIAILPRWAHTVEKGVLFINTAIVILGFLVSFAVSDITSPDPDSSAILSLFGKSC